MKLGLVGVGRMGAGLRSRLIAAGHEVVAYDLDPRLRDVESLDGLIGKLDPPRAIWVMLPAGAVTGDTIATLGGILAAGDLVVDGGNSNWRDSVRRAADLEASGVRFLDVGTSGGVAGGELGFCLMVGGDTGVVEGMRPAFDAIAAPGGYARLGPNGAGHYAKMVHNAIEYGLLQAYAEGFALLDAGGEFNFDLAQVANLWGNGSVVRSWLLELAGQALAADPALQSVAPFVQDSGEGRWAVAEAVERGVDVGAIARALFARFESQDTDSLAMRLIAALRKEFGGHATRARG